MFGFLTQTIAVGAHAVGLVTHATPAMNDKALTEAYLTQPAIMADASWRALQFIGMLNFEGLTLERGELNHGVYGEGYVDRRHPHTYLHEAVITAQEKLAPVDVSLSAGRGFAPYGSDDPMVRPFVKYPANHHLAQILERWIVVGALRGGPVMLEAGWFSGAEPQDPEDLGDVGMLGDSWSARATLLPRPWLELQGSYALVHSPENTFGQGLDHEMWHASARLQHNVGGMDVYALLETGETNEGSGDFQFFEYRTLLAEAALRRGLWQAAVRFERTIRPEEERQFDLFRSVRPHHDNSILGTTRWTSGTIHVSRDWPMSRVRLEPFVEIVRLHAEALEEFPVLLPERIYGSDRLWSFSFGVRSTLGMWHDRMGRYGAARVATAIHHH
jgi:hypothetical protein